MHIKLSSILHTYESASSFWTLRIDDFKVEKNEKIFIHGPSGSGKTTFLRIIAGLTSPQKGSITLFDQRIDMMGSREKDRFRASNIGFVFQQFNLIPYLSALENVRLAQNFGGQKNRTTEIPELFYKLNFNANDLSKPAWQLSIGQQQRVAIVRALINKPNLLIVDEPTSSLDEKNKEDFMNMLLEKFENNKMSLLFVSHDIKLSDHFENVIAFDRIAAAEHH